MERLGPALVERADLYAPIMASDQEQQRDRGADNGDGAEHQSRGGAAQSVLESQNREIIYHRGRHPRTARTAGEQRRDPCRRANPRPQAPFHAPAHAHIHPRLPTCMRYYRVRDSRKLFEGAHSHREGMIAPAARSNWGRLRAELPSGRRGEAARLCAAP